MPRFYYGQKVWPDQEWADKSGEIEFGYVTEVYNTPAETRYCVQFVDGHLEYDIPEDRLSETRPLPPDPNDLMKEIL